MSNEKLVYIIDDDDAVRRSAAFMLRNSGYRVSTHASGASFLKDLKPAERGCVVLDVGLPGMDGLEIQQEMVRRGIDMPVVILTGCCDVSVAVRAMRAGAVNFIAKPCDKDALLGAIDEACLRLECQQDREIQASEARIRLASLTGRERDVLDGLVAGHPNKTIAQDLGISPRTVEVYRAKMMHKLRVRSLSEALRIGFIAQAEVEPNHQMATAPH